MRNVTGASRTNKRATSYALDAERGLPKYERVALRWLVRCLTEVTPGLRDSGIRRGWTATLAKREQETHRWAGLSARSSAQISGPCPTIPRRGDRWDQRHPLALSESVIEANGTALSVAAVQRRWRSTSTGMTSAPRPASALRWPRRSGTRVGREFDVYNDDESGSGDRVPLEGEEGDSNVESQLPYVKALIDEVGIERLVELEVEAVKVRPIPPKLIRDLGREQALSGHEVRIVGLLAEGLSKPEIARVVGSAPETIKSHMKSIHFKRRCTHRRPDGGAGDPGGLPARVEEASSGDRLSVALSGSSPRDRASSRSSRLDSSTSHPGGLLRCTAYSAEVTKWRSLVSMTTLDESVLAFIGTEGRTPPAVAEALPRLRRDAPSTGAARRPDSGRARCGWPRGRSRTRGDALRAHSPGSGGDRIDVID